MPLDFSQVPYDESTNIDIADVPIGGTQIHQLYAVNNLQERIPILKTVVIRSPTLQELVDAMINSPEFKDFFDEYMIQGQWLRYSTEIPAEFELFKESTLYLNTSDTYFTPNNILPEIGRASCRERV